MRKQKQEQQHKSNNLLEPRENMTLMNENSQVLKNQQKMEASMANQVNLSPSQQLKHI